MDITSAQYIRNRDDTDNIAIAATIDGQDMEVPLDPANRRPDTFNFLSEKTSLA